MIFTSTILEGVYIVDLEPHYDTRGFFARAWCQNEFSDHNLMENFVQCSISFNHLKGTLRGMHFQVVPNKENKIVRCTMGRIYDVVLDLRPVSVSYRRWISVELSAVNRKSIYIPQGLAHGFQTLEDNCEVFYQISEFYHPECSRRVGWNDPAFNIMWPLPNPIMSDADRNYIPFSEQDFSNL